MERNINHHAPVGTRIHPSAILIKMLVNSINNQPDLLYDPTTAVATLAENVSEFNAIPRPHSLSTYGRTRVSDIDVEVDEDCIVCKEKLEITVSMLPCGHLFHKSCIEGWFNSHSTCPICRTNIDYY